MSVHQVAAVMIATGRIAAAHESFNRICLVPGGANVHSHGFFLNPRESICTLSRFFAGLLCAHKYAYVSVAIVCNVTSSTKLEVQNISPLTVS